MEKINCIVIEDEPLAAEILQDYIRQLPSLQLKGVCGHVITAMEILNEHQIDLIFLDIHLPKIKGIDFIRTLRSAPSVIITSAHEEYAFEGYELNVIDYLLKPIEFSRFITAVNKVPLRTIVSKLNPDTSGDVDKPHLFFNVSKQKVKVYTDNILFVESLKEYVKIVTQNKTIVTKLLLAEVEDVLGTQNFIRIHRSFIVSKSKIDALTATEVHISDKVIPIGRSYKEAVLARFKAAN
jgi:DNA-binding LytR/AlgR family response regulator